MGGKCDITLGFGVTRGLGGGVTELVRPWNLDDHGRTM